MLVTQSDVWAAAALAWRINDGKYIRTSTETHTANKRIVYNLLTNDSSEVTDADRALGELARSTIACELTRKLLSDIPLSEFEQSTLRATNVPSWETPSTADWGVITYQIAVYTRLQESLAVSQSLNDSYVGDVGSAVKLAATVIKSIWSVRYNTGWTWAKTDSGELVMFAYRDVLTTGDRLQIAGRVKSHTSSDEYGVRMTQLNRVRIT